MDGECSLLAFTHCCAEEETLVASLIIIIFYLIDSLYPFTNKTLGFQLCVLPPPPPSQLGPRCSHMKILWGASRELF